MADNLAAIVPHDEALPDILVVEDGPDVEQAEPPDELFQRAASDTALALDEDMVGAAAESAALLSTEAPYQSHPEDVLAAESPMYALPQDAADSAPEDSHMESGNEKLATDTWGKRVIDEHAEEAHQADEKYSAIIEDTPEHAESAQELPDAVAAEVAAVTDELLDMAISEDQAMTAEQPPGEEEAVGAALEATIEGLVSTTEAAKPGQLTAVDQQTDAEDPTVEDPGSTEEAGDAGNESVVTIYKGVPVLSIVQPHTLHAAASEPQETPHDDSKIAQTSAAEQQALANSILSGWDGQASPPDSVNASLVQVASADSNAATLDSLIGSRYLSQEFAAGQGTGNEAHGDAKPSPGTDQVTGGEGDSTEQGPTVDALVNVPELQPARQEDVHMPDTHSAGFATQGQQGDFGETATPSASILTPSNDTEDTASPYAAADTGHVSTPKADLDEPGLAETTSRKTHTLTPASDTEDAASPDAAADTVDEATAKAPLLKPSHEESTSPSTYTLAPASDTEDAASPDAAVDTKHYATATEASLLKPSHTETPSEAATLVTHDSVQVNLTLVSSGAVTGPTDEAEPAGRRRSAGTQPNEEAGPRA